MSVSNGFTTPDQVVQISDSTSSKYRLLTGDGTDTTNALMVLKAATGQTDTVIAISQEATTAADQQATARFWAVSKLEVNGSGTSIDIGTPIIPTTGGVGIAAKTGGSTAQRFSVTALQPSAASGDVILVKLHAPVYYAVANS